MKRTLPFLGASLLSLLFLAGCTTQGGSASLSVGTQAPNFTVITSDGQTISLTDFRGRILLLTSTATWCNTCVIEAENLRPVYEELKGRGVEFLTVSIDPREDIQTLERFRASARTPWFYATAEGADSLIRDYAFDRFEITFIIDQQGIIRFVDNTITQTGELRTILSSLLPPLTL